MLKNFNKILFAISVLSVFSLLVACTDKEETQKPSVDKKPKKESLEKANRYLFLKEKEDIDDYIARHGIKVVETGTGLRYRIIKQGDGELIKQGDIIVIDYEVRLLNGKLLYSSKEDGLKTMKVGRGGVETGLEEAFLNLHKGDIAEIIIPSHLAHGLIGDGNRIPPRQPIVYKLKIIDNQINK